MKLSGELILNIFFPSWQILGLLSLLTSDKSVLKPLASSEYNWNTKWFMNLTICQPMWLCHYHLKHGWRLWMSPCYFISSPGLKTPRGFITTIFNSPCCIRNILKKKNSLSLVLKSNWSLVWQMVVSKNIKKFELISWRVQEWEITSHLTKQNIGFVFWRK